MKPLGLLLLAFTSFLPVNGQEQKNTQHQDTSGKKVQFNNSELFLTQPELLPPQSYNVLPTSFSEYLNQSLSVPMPSFSWTFKSKLDLEHSWKQELAKQDEYRTLRTILSSVQMGGVAYLTYLHLKKYGLK